MVMINGVAADREAFSLQDTPGVKSSRNFVRILVHHALVVVMAQTLKSEPFSIRR